MGLRTRPLSLPLLHTSLPAEPIASPARPRPVTGVRMSRRRIPMRVAASLSASGTPQARSTTRRSGFRTPNTTCRTRRIALLTRYATFRARHAACANPTHHVPDAAFRVLNSERDVRDPVHRAVNAMFRVPNAERRVGQPDRPRAGPGTPRVEPDIPRCRPDRPRSGHDTSRGEHEARDVARGTPSKGCDHSCDGHSVRVRLRRAQAHKRNGPRGCPRGPSITRWN